MNVFARRAATQVKKGGFYLSVAPDSTNFVHVNRSNGGERVKRYANTLMKVALSVALGSAILYWMYRGVDFSSMRGVALHDMDWWWMLLSLPFGILAQAFRGWRWGLTLSPLGFRPRAGVAVCSIFVSYAVSLIVPRIGEFTRCGILAKKDGVSFVKSLGTVVAERIVDSLLLLVVTVLVIVSQFAVFDRFFNRTGFNLADTLRGFSWQGYLVTLVCIAVAVFSLHLLLRKMTFYERVRLTAKGLLEGVTSLAKVGNAPRFVVFTFAIWLCYFLHYYLTFFCFDATRGLSLSCALVTFVVGSIAVIVPTPNGAGPWHFAVKTMLILYGVGEEDALFFVFIVHAVQTLLVVVLGLVGWLWLSFAPTLDKQNNVNIK